MKLLHAAFDNEENLASVTVHLSLDELALIYRVVGHTAPRTITDASGGHQRWGEALDDVATGAGNIINTFFENGVDDIAPKFSAFQVGK